jgi:prefoldin subunit 5
MANLLRKIEPIAYQTESPAILKRSALKSEIIDNIEELSKEINYLKDKVKILVSAPTADHAELTDTIFKLRDLRDGVIYRKQYWEELISSMDVMVKVETEKAMDMLKSMTEKLEGLIEESTAYQKF